MRAQKGFRRQVGCQKFGFGFYGLGLGLRGCLWGTCVMHALGVVSKTDFAKAPA